MSQIYIDTLIKALKDKQKKQKAINKQDFEEICRKCYSQLEVDFFIELNKLLLDNKNLKKQVQKLTTENFQKFHVKYDFFDISLDLKKEQIFIYKPETQFEMHVELENFVSYKDYIKVVKKLNKKYKTSFRENPLYWYKSKNFEKSNSYWN